MSLFDRNLSIFKLLKPNYTDRRVGYLGRYNPDGSIDPDPQSGLSDEYVWVRFGEGRGATRVKNLKVRAAWGTPVWVDFNELTREDEVTEVHGVLAPQTLGGAVAAATNVPPVTAAISTPTSAQDVQPGSLQADSAVAGLNVRILPTWIPGGAWWNGTALIALTPTATSSMKSFCVVGIDPATGLATTSLTADRSLAVTLVNTSHLPTANGAADIKAVCDADPAIWWVGAVELANGATTINPARIVDRRFWDMPTMVGADGSSAGVAGFVPKPAAADNTKYLKGDGTWDTPAGSGVTDPLSNDLDAGAYDIMNLDRLELNEVSAPGTPSSGKLSVYAKTDGRVYSKNDSGTEYDLTSAGGGGSAASVGTYAGSRPATPSTGALYIVTDGVWNQEVYDGSNWRPMHDGALLTIPPSSSWTTLGSPTVDSALGAINLTSTGAATGDHRGQYRTAPATPYTVTAYMAGGIPMTNLNTFGLFFRESSSGKLATLDAIIASGIWYAQFGKWTDATTFSANYGSAAIGFIPRWLRIKDDGTDRILYVSNDGKYWQQVHTVGRTDFLTADQIGFFIDCRSTAVSYTATLLSWEVT